MKVVINGDFGGFSLSEDAIRDLGLLEFADREINRDNKELIELIETKGSEYVSGSYASLVIIEFSEEYYIITDYDGSESVYVSNSPIRWVG